MVKKKIVRLDVDDDTFLDVIGPFEIVPDSCVRVFYRGSSVCRHCVNFSYCKNKADVVAAANCGVSFDPELLICKTCKRVGLCKSNCVNEVFLDEQT